MTNTTYEDLNAEIFLLDSDGNIQFEKDKEATRAYFLEEVNRRTRFFYTLKEKVNYLLDNELWKRETVEMFSFDQFKALFKQAHEHKYRFESFMGARKFFTQYALADVDGNTFVERFEDRVVLTAIDLSGGDYDAAKDLVDAIITGRFQPATPTFLNAGRAQGGERVSCFLLRVEDNTESITRCFTSAAQLSRRGGGVGINASNLRESGATIQKTPKASKGLIPFMKVLEDEFKYFDQLGQRQGAGVVYVNAHHPDIMRVLDTKRENADEAVRLKTLSIGVVIPDITFDLAKRNADMYLFSPSDVEKVEGKAFADLSVTENYDRWVEDERITKSKVNARQFFQTLSELQFESGYPYILFEDEANRTHTLSEVGRIQMSNLCSEILQVQSPGKFNEDCSYLDEGADISCNLGSFNIDKMWKLNKEEFIDTVISATKALDQVSRTTSIKSVPSVRKGNELSHSIGLGQMNLHGALGVRRIFYDSDEARAMFSKHMALTTFAAMLASTQLAKEYGTHAYYDQSEYADGSWFRRVVDPWIEEYGDDLEIVDGLSAPTADEWKQLELEVAKYGMANAYLQAVPPTGSISYINHSTSSIHPVAAPIEIRKEGKTGRTYYPAPGMNNDNLEYFQSAAEIGPEATILMYEKGQHWVDQGMSLTLFFPDKVTDAKTGELRATTTRDINRAQIFAWRHHIKTLYYVRIVQAAMDGTQVDGTAMGLIREVQAEACTSCQL